MVLLQMVTKTVQYLDNDFLRQSVVYAGDLLSL